MLELAFIPRSKFTNTIKTAKRMNNTNEVIAAILVLAGYVIKQIDLTRIKRGKKPLFAFLDVVK